MKKSSANNSLRCLICVLFTLLASHLSAREPVKGATPHPDVPMLPDGYIAYQHDHDYVEMAVPFYQVDEEDKLSIVRKAFHGDRQTIEYAFPDQDHFLRAFRSYVNRFENDPSLKVKYAKYGAALRTDSRAVNVNNHSTMARVFNQGLSPDSNDFSERGFIILEPVNANESYSFLTVSIYKPSSERYYPGLRVYINQFTQDNLDLIELPDVEVDLTPPEKTELETSLTQDGKAIVNAILFEFDSDLLMAESAESIDVLVDLLQENPKLKLYVVGHTDWIGSYDYNINLSKSRATAVVNRLVNAHNINPSRLVPVGVGPVAPVTSNETEKGRSLNRRVEIVNFE